MELLIIIGFLTVIVNVGITALNIKLYTEYFKDRSSRARDKMIEHNKSIQTDG